jgi:hypothetical protein
MRRPSGVIGQLICEMNGATRRWLIVSQQSSSDDGEVTNGRLPRDSFNSNSDAQITVQAGNDESRDDGGVVIRLMDATGAGLIARPLPQPRIHACGAEPPRPRLRSRRSCPQVGAEEWSLSLTKEYFRKDPLNTFGEGPRVGSSNSVIKNRRKHVLRAHAHVRETVGITLVLTHGSSGKPKRCGTKVPHWLLRAGELPSDDQTPSGELEIGLIDACHADVKKSD